MLLTIHWGLIETAGFHSPHWLLGFILRVVTMSRESVSWNCCGSCEHCRRQRICETVTLRIFLLISLWLSTRGGRSASLKVEYRLSYLPNYNVYGSFFLFLLKAPPPPYDGSAREALQLLGWYGIVRATRPASFEYCFPDSTRCGDAE